MSRTKLKMVVAGATLGIAAALLAFSGMREGWVYFLPVDEFVQDTNRHEQRVRLHGKVGTEHLDVNNALLSAKFDLLGKTQSIRVAYTGVIPEMFQAQSDVVVEGRLNSDGVFHADTLMTKCASKYDSAEGQAPHADPRLRKEQAS